LFHLQISTTKALVMLVLADRTDLPVIPDRGKMRAQPKGTHKVVNTCFSGDSP
jgi:hypothetical protein